MGASLGDLACEEIRVMALLTDGGEKKSKTTARVGALPSTLIVLEDLR